MLAVLGAMGAQAAIHSTDRQYTARHSRNGDVWKVRLEGADSAPLTWADAARGFGDPTFAEFFSTVLASSPYDNFFWESPPLNRQAMSAPVEFVTVRARPFRQPDPSAFEKHLAAAEDRGEAAATFTNLAGDTVLVSPVCPQGSAHAGSCGHIANFVRNAPVAEQVQLWAAVGAALREAVGLRTVWLNTEGSGVPWLHVRLDPKPKYYHHAEYKHSSGG
eukprot:TRINITY_DN2437_c0_g1_i2.p2 TRINITY_DN2437_c0_g1~~TRINITY_DN2437_c0_g1_i2.p2  ORF type:complete len:219 (+),score=45.37 TRINITY_DN2437_c0_g1_i2:31-687(+)